MYLQLSFFPPKLLQTCPVNHDGLQYDPNISLTHEHSEETNGHTRNSTKKNYPSYELIEFIPLDGQAKENSKHAAERSSHLLRVGLVLIVG
jgi:hypothetical protein